MSGFGYQPPRISLGDFTFKIDPKLQEDLRKLQIQLAANSILDDVLRPDWSLILPDFKDMLASKPDPFKLTIPPDPTVPPSSSGGAPTPRFGSEPDVARAGEMADLTKAIYKLPIVQQIAKNAHDEAMRQVNLLGKEWTAAPTPEKVIMVSMGAIVAGAIVTPIVANKPTRDMAFGLIKGNDIPVPGVDGLSFRILDYGGGITTPLGVPGLKLGTDMQFPNSRAVSYKVTVDWDVTEFLRSRGLPF